MTSPAPFELAVLIGRFQPFHNGHAGLLDIALANAPQVIVVLGSSFHARSAKNPFTWEERAAMIAGSLSATDRERVTFVAIRDYYEDTRWAVAVREKVQARAGGPRRTALVGHLKDSSSYYLKHFPQWELIEAENMHDLDSTRIRRVLFEAEDIAVSLDVIAGLVPIAVRQYLKGWSMLKPFTALSWEHAKVAAYKASWSSAPFPPIFSTVDAVVRTAHHVLLIKRGDFPGKGLWALPGGFLDQRERLIQGAVRELIEETRIAVLMSSLSDAFVESKVFDHPDRSQRGRTITHAHLFDLKTEHLPAVEAADDAALAAWIPIAQLASMEDQFFDDHFHILNHFLRITDD